MYPQKMDDPFAQALPDHLALCALHTLQCSPVPSQDFSCEISSHTYIKCTTATVTEKRRQPRKIAAAPALSLYKTILFEGWFSFGDIVLPAWEAGISGKCSLYFPS